MLNPAILRVFPYLFMAMSLKIGLLKHLLKLSGISEDEL
jgi:hypothetical protein